MLLILMLSLTFGFAADVEYLTLNVGGHPVVIVLAEHPVITYTDNMLHIQTTEKTVDVPVSQISDMTFRETTGIQVAAPQRMQMQEGSICFQQLPKGSQISVIAANGIEVLSTSIDDTGQVVINIGKLPKGVYIVKTISQTFKITNK